MKRKLSFFVVLAALLLLFVACENSNNSIIGTWGYSFTMDGNSVEMELTFNSDGTGTQVTKLNGIEIAASKETFTFTYVAPTLIVTGEDGVPESGECIIDGNKMTMKNTSSPDIVLTRK